MSDTPCLCGYADAGEHVSPRHCVQHLKREVVRKNEALLAAAVKLEFISKAFAENWAIDWNQFDEAAAAAREEMNRMNTTPSKSAMDLARDIFLSVHAVKPFIDDPEKGPLVIAEISLMLDAFVQEFWTELEKIKGWAIEDEAIRRHRRDGNCECPITAVANKKKRCFYFFRGQRGRRC